MVAPSSRRRLLAVFRIPASKIPFGIGYAADVWSFIFVARAIAPSETDARVTKVPQCVRNNTLRLHRLLFVTSMPSTITTYGYACSFAGAGTAEPPLRLAVAGFCPRSAGGPSMLRAFAIAA